MTDVPGTPPPEDEEKSWAAFDDEPAASIEIEDISVKELTETDFGDEACEEDDDEWNDFEFASAPIPAPQQAFPEQPPPPPDTVRKSEPSFPVVENEETVGTGFASTQSSSLNAETLICDLGQILNNCLKSSPCDRPLIRRDNDEEEAEEIQNHIETKCSDHHDGLHYLLDLIGENGDFSIQRKEDDQSCDTTADEIRTLWTSLRLIEEAAALKYQWNEARAHERYLNALRMDPKVAKLRNPKLPAFAWQLSNSALTPEKPATNNNTSVLTPTEQNSTAADSSPDIGFSATNGQAKIHGGGSANGTIVASVQFDWNSSGLSNPLSEGLADSCAIDLDYFSGGKMVAHSPLGRYDIGESEQSATVNATTTDAWKTDLKLLGLMTDDSDTSNATIPEISHPPTIAKSSASTTVTLLEKLMKSNHRTAAGLLSTSSETELSQESRNLLDSLPDLSFMLSPVLMFPIREDLRSDGGDDVQL